MDFDATETRAYCDRYINGKVRPNQRIMIFGESLVEQSKAYFTPITMPLSIIAQRLRDFVPDPTILFTLRNQYDYVASSYLNLKRNCETLNAHIIEPFDIWFNGQCSEVRNLYLRTLNYAKAISVFSDALGRQSIKVCPLETVKHHGATRFLEDFGNQLHLPITASDEDAFARVENRRMSRLEETFIELARDAKFRDFF